MSNGLDRELGAISVALVALEKGQQRIELQLCKKLDDHMAEDDERHKENIKRMRSIEWKVIGGTAFLSGIAAVLKFFWL